MEWCSVGCFDFHRIRNSTFHVKSFVSGAQFMGFLRICCKFIVHKLFKVWRQSRLFHPFIHDFSVSRKKLQSLRDTQVSCWVCETSYHDGHFNLKTRLELPNFRQLVQNEFTIFLQNICRSRIRRQNSKCGKRYLQICGNRITQV